MESGISNGALSVEDVPPSAQHVQALTEFALSFDGYAHWGERCGERAAAVATAYRESGEFPADLADLRACLFYEQQKWRW
ncbi:MAG: hypothetical protein GWM90_31000, partial [Gemmatimonadetes bacterium]|nr:hypothetical protein [Gemmatimonadota bacterium]NIQ59631.1 hypothetical protein [Gemmatimonadota bacterium]NIU79837.1 hypothetical protein [Gammaproteobacteria bacterium]NIX48330.1 hypothetical protein [Gemmatimonadota bacterium]NIY12775.1 hypothetical protein [Gemmatimonadota bacterium]